MSKSIKNKVKLNDAVSVKDFGAVGDGTTDDTAAIQAALDTGKAVYVPATASYYKITSALTLNTNQRIFGDGTGSQIRQVTSLANVLSATSKSGVTVEKLYLYCAGTFGSYATGAGILLNLCSQSIIKDCVVTNHRGAGVNLYSSNECLVENNTFINSPVVTTDLDSQAFADIAVVYSSSRNSIQGNLCISGQGTGILVQSVVNGNTCDANIVSGNIIKNSKVYGIGLYRNAQVIGDVPLQSVGRCVVSGNTIENVSGSLINSVTSTYTYGTGIYVQGAEDSVICGNTIKSTHTAAVTFSELLSPGAIGATNVTRFNISNNLIRDAGMFGIDLNDGNGFGAATGFAVIENNSINSCARSGISSRQRGRIAIVGNCIDTVTGDSGIEINNTSLYSNINITGNQVRNITGTGLIEIKYGKSVSITSNLVDTSSVHGITVSNSEQVFVRSNTVLAHTVRGIQITSSCVSPISVTDNTIIGTGASNEGIRLDAVGRYAQNQISGCVSAWIGTFAPYNTLTVNSTTPSVIDGSKFITNNTAATKISNFTSGYDGQEIDIIFTDANTTLDFTSSNLKGNVGVDRLMQIQDSIRAVYRSSSFAWHVTINAAS